MTALPAKTGFTSRSLTQAQFKPSIEALRDYLSGLLDNTGAAPAARTKLGLGSASTRNAGTGSSDLPDNAAVAAVVASLIDEGATTVFVQASAPTGWQQVTSVNDRVLRVTNRITGSADRGGSTGGGWTISGLSASVSVASRALSIAELPSHNHGGGNHRHATANVEVRHTTTWDNGSGTGEIYIFDNTWGGPRTVDLNNAGNSIPSQGGGAGHAHPGSTAAVSAGSAWRPKYVNCIIASKT